jgi:uncharacterized protein with FMN-binding domain
MHSYRLIPALVVTAMSAFPMGSAWGTAHAATQSNVAWAHAAANATKYKGPLVNMRWGPVQATITVKGKKITSVKITTLPENFRSQFIDQQAVPLLKQETLQAQSANVAIVSGATMTSAAYIQSLQAALQKAHL